MIAPPPLIFAGGLAAGLLLQWVAPLRVFAGTPFRIAGWALAVIAGLLAFWGARTMRRAGTHIDPRRPAVMVVTSGPVPLQ